jgi:plastocyanin
MLVVLALLACGAQAGCAVAGGKGAPTETEPPTYYTGGLGGTPAPAGGQPRATQNRPTQPAPTAAPAAPPTTAARPAPQATTGGQPPGAFAAVDIEGFAFGPASQNARVGQKVVWSNQDATTHTVTANNLTWGKNLPPGSTYVHVFVRPGTFGYHCAIHPTMRGVVVVT